MVFEKPDLVDRTGVIETKFLISRQDFFGKAFSTSPVLPTKVSKRKDLFYFIGRQNSIKKRKTKRLCKNLYNRFLIFMLVCC